MRHLFAMTVILCALALPAMAQETRSFTDHAGRIVTIPANPQRIAALGASLVTVPLIELGVMPIASQGTVRMDGSKIIRASKVTTGADFDTSDIRFLGDNPVDIEAVAAARPDLIILPDWQNVSLDQLEKIAPTLVYASNTPLHEAQAFFAELTGTGERLALNRARYDAQVAQIRALVPEGTTVSYFQGNKGGKLFSWNEYGHIGALLRDAGFVFPDIINTIPKGEHRLFSAEKLTDLDADWIFITYRTDHQQTPLDAIEGMKSVLPNWCEVLEACRAGRVVYLPRAEAVTPSYDAAMAVAFAIVSHLSDPARRPERLE